MGKAQSSLHSQREKPRGRKAVWIWGSCKPSRVPILRFFSLGTVLCVSLMLSSLALWKLRSRVLSLLGSRWTLEDLSGSLPQERLVEKCDRVCSGEQETGVLFDGFSCLDFGVYRWRVIYRNYCHNLIVFFLWLLEGLCAESLAALIRNILRDILWFLLVSYCLRND